jgi:sugar phosphate isomerase/epimerase
MSKKLLCRRKFCERLGLGLSVAALSPTKALLAERSPFQLRYIVASCLYGEMPLAEILPEIRKTGSEFIDIWPRKHGNQREQMDEMGHDQFASLLRQHKIKLGIITRYDLGPFKLQPEMAVLKKLGGKMIVCAGSGPKNLGGSELKSAVKQFVEEMQPHIAAAEEAGITIAIENHGNNLIDSPDSLKWLAEFAPSKHIGIALAPYHLPDNAETVANLIRALGKKSVHFYAWQHGMGCTVKLPKEQELMQMPGRGKLDFVPILKALKEINYSGWTSIFMHPVPRGIPILETAADVTAEINRARNYLDGCLKKN